MALGQPLRAVPLFDGLIEVLPLRLQPEVAQEQARCLAAAGQPDVGLSILEAWVTRTPSLPKAVLSSLVEAKAELLLGAAKPKEAAKAFQTASSLATGSAARERLLLGAAKAARDGAEADLCESLAAPLSASATKAALMEEARRLLVQIGRPPKWTMQQRLERTRLLIDRRAFEPAIVELTALAEVKNDVLSMEAKWLLALAQYNRRGHYAKALAALRPFSEEKGPRADEASFLMASALSRLNRDEEAIPAFKTLARELARKDPSRSAECLYFAGRLEHYLGRHKAATATLARAFAKNPAASKLSATDRREALFLAGLSSLLSGSPKPAVTFFEQSAIGSESSEVSARGKYWAAVATHELGPEKGLATLEEVCRRDPTSWYGALAAGRLAEAGGKSGGCTPVPVLKAQDRPSASVPLAKLSDAAAFLYEAGFSRQAASALRAAEESSAGKSGDADWIYYYNLLDAPSYAIRRATSSLRWPPTENQLALARAAYPRPFAELVQQVEDLHGLPKDLIYAIARKESSFDPAAVSSVGAMGLMQMMPATYEKNRKRASLPPLESAQLPTPESSIRASAYELAELLERLDGQLPLAIMAYNAGPGAVLHWLERSGDQPLDVFVEQAGFAQTRNYVRRTYENLARYRLLEGAQPPPLPKVARRIRAKSGDGGVQDPGNPATSGDTEPLERSSEE
jgi:soluble lytic murein transglycosylase